MKINFQLYLFNSVQNKSPYHLSCLRYSFQEQPDKQHLQFSVLILR